MKKPIFTLLMLIPIFVMYPQDTINVPGDYTTIQSAIDASNDGDIVLVAEDTYHENINFNGKAITVASHFFIDGDETYIENTIIDGSQPSHPDSGSVVFFISGEDTNSVLCGFTITGGTGTIAVAFNLVWRLGGGINVLQSGATIKNNIIESNVIQYDQYAAGGGINAISEFGQNFIIENNIIRYNSIISANAQLLVAGGGISARTSGSVRIANNLIIDNTITASVAYGGGIETDGVDNYSVVNNIIAGNIVNAASGGGGGIDIVDLSVTFRNNLIVNNSAPRGGGILIEFFTSEANLNSGRGYDIEMLADGDNYQSSIQDVPFLENYTVVNNTATIEGGGISILGPVVPNLMNFIIWGNTAPSGPQISGSATVVYSDVEGGWSGTGNIDIYPEFMDMTNGDFHLSDNSLCIGAGIDSIEIGGTWYFSPLTDLEGNPRPNPPGSMPDMGAYESKLGSPVTDIRYDFSQIPNEYSLAQNYPNPFNPSTTIEFALPEADEVKLTIYNTLGQEIATLVSERLTAGKYKYNWDAGLLASGVYLYKIQAGNYVEAKKMILLR